MTYEMFSRIKVAVDQAKKGGRSTVTLSTIEMSQLVEELGSGDGMHFMIGVNKDNNVTVTLPRFAHVLVFTPEQVETFVIGIQTAAEQAKSGSLRSL